MKIASDDFAFVVKLVRESSAIVLEPGKEYLVELRLGPLAQTLGFAGIPELLKAVKMMPFSPVATRVVEAMTTNETSFFRDVHPFEALRTEILPRLIQRRQHVRTLNLWCAAASSGQEPYSILMLMREHFPELAGWRVNYVATDISREMIERCRAGLYNQLEVGRGLPAQLLVKHFARRGTHWQIKDELRAAVDFRELNLCKPWIGIPQPVDLVTMRNVLIYFDLAVKREILTRVARQLASDGLLMLGGSESTINICDEFETVPLGRTTCYRSKQHAKESPWNTSVMRSAS